MKRLNIAMLGDQGQEESTIAVNVDTDALELSQSQADIESEQVVIDESMDISESIGNTADAIEQMSSVPQEVLKVAQE